MRLSACVRAFVCMSVNFSCVWFGVFVGLAYFKLLLRCPVYFAKEN